MCGSVQTGMSTLEALSETNVQDLRLFDMRILYRLPPCRSLAVGNESINDAVLQEVAYESACLMVTIRDWTGRVKTTEASRCSITTSQTNEPSVISCPNVEMWTWQRRGQSHRRHWRFQEDVACEANCVLEFFKPGSNISSVARKS